MAKPTEDLTRQDRKLLSLIMEYLPLGSLSVQEEQSFIDGKGGAAHWLTLQIKRYSSVKNDPNILLVDRSVKFDTSFIARPCFDSRDGGKWQAFDMVPLSQRDNPEFDISKIELWPITQSPEDGEYPLDARALQSFLLQKERIPKGWLEQINGKDVSVVFAGTRLIDTYGNECYLALRPACIPGGWDWCSFKQAEISANNSVVTFMVAVYAPSR